MLQSLTNPGSPGLFDHHHSLGLHPLEPIRWHSPYIGLEHSLGLHRQLIWPLGQREAPRLKSTIQQNLVWWYLFAGHYLGGAIQLSLLTLTLATFLILYHLWKGSELRKGVCAWHPMPWASLPGVPLAWSPFLEGSGLSSSVPSPPFSLNVDQFCMPSPTGNHGWNALGCCNGSSISPPAKPPSLPGQGTLWIP